MATKAFLAVGILHRADDVQRASAGGQADQHVTAAKVQVLQVHRPLRFVVFDVLYGAQYGFMAARDNTTTCSGRVPKVGGHSLASRIPRRPEVPAPM